ncbi:glycosyltransferase [Bosea minatitlanensis]
MVVLIEGLVRLGVHCEVFVFDGSGPLRPRLDAENVTVHVATHARRIAHLAKLGNLATFVRAFVALWWLALTTKPEILQAYLPLTNFMGAVAGRLAGVPLVITCRRGLGTHQDRYPWWRIFDRIANKLSHVVTVNSQAVADDTAARDGIEPSRLILIRNGLDSLTTRTASVDGERWPLRQKLGLQAGEIGFINVANLIPYKGQADLLEAFAVARATIPPSKLFIVGRDDGLGAQLKALAAALGITEKVQFLGARHDIPNLLSAMDIFVLPSHEEGSSNALLEALACGLPVIATDVGGNREALDNGSFGLLVPPRAPKILAETMKTIAENLPVWRDTGAQAAEFIQRSYSSEALANNYMKLYRNKLCRE